MAEQRHLLLDRVCHCILASTHNLQSYLKEKFQIYLEHCTNEKSAFPFCKDRVEEMVFYRKM